jgi:hypothetical protein
MTTTELDTTIAGVEARLSALGSAREAEVQVLVANARHGKRLSGAETRAAIRRMLLLDTGLSYRAIARLFGATHPTVMAVARSLEVEEAYRQYLSAQDLGPQEREEWMARARALPAGEKWRIWEAPRAAWASLVSQAIAPRHLAVRLARPSVEAQPAEPVRLLLRRPAQDQDQEEEEPAAGSGAAVWLAKLEQRIAELKQAGERALCWYRECEVLFGSTQPDHAPRLHELRDRLHQVAEDVRARADELYEEADEEE